MKITDKCVQVDNERDLKEMLGAKKRLVALFYASWCPYCVKFLPVFERNAQCEGLGFAMIKDDQERMMDLYSIDIVPTVILFEGGNVSTRLDGVPHVGLTEKQLTDFIASCRER
jgi:thioredoxin 1